MPAGLRLFDTYIVCCLVSMNPLLKLLKAILLKSQLYYLERIKALVTSTPTLQVLLHKRLKGAGVPLAFKIAHSASVLTVRE